MASMRSLPVLLLALAGCGPRPHNTAPRPLIPKDGPSANVRVEYRGGLFARQLEAYFNVQRPAYVMVAHLGGDGVVRVLFPEDPRESGFVRGGRTFRTDASVGSYDAAPGYWFLRPTFYRTNTARWDSYDGNGHGFVFVIASDWPLRFDRISSDGFWDDATLEGYELTADPRRLVRAFADRMAPSGKYTLDFASSFQSQGAYSYAATRMDCAMLSGLWFTPWSHAYGLGYLGSHHYGASPRSCRGVDDDYFWWLNGYRGRPIAVASANPAPPDTTSVTPRPVTPRPGRRDPLRPGRRDVSENARAYRTGELGRRASDWRGTRDGERVYPAPSTPRFEPRASVGGRRAAFDSPRDARETSRREPPAPRTSEPASTSRSAGSDAPARGAGTGGGGGRPDVTPIRDRDP